MTLGKENPKRRNEYFIYKEKTSWRICDVINLIDELGEDQREIILASLYQLLSLESIVKIEKFKEEWKPKEEDWFYTMRENRVIKNCIAYELSPDGTDYRRSTGMPPLNEETKLDFEGL